MKKSIIILVGAVICFVVLYGAMYGPYSKIFLNQDGDPVGVFSKFWVKVYDLKFRHDLDKEIKYVKIIGEGKKPYVSLQYVSADVKQIWSGQPQYCHFEAVGDTLIIRTNDLAQVNLFQKNAPEQVFVESARFHIPTIANLFDTLSVSAEGASQVTLGSSWRAKEQKDTISSLRIDLKGKSTGEILGIRTHILHSNIEDGLLEFAKNFVSDTVSVDLSGRSTLKVDDPGAVNGVKNFLVTGDKKFFRKEHLGNSAHLVTE